MSSTKKAHRIDIGIIWHLYIWATDNLGQTMSASANQYRELGQNAKPTFQCFFLSWCKPNNIINKKFDEWDLFITKLWPFLPVATSGCESGHFTSQLFAHIIKFLHSLFSVNMFCVSPGGTKPDIDQINWFCSGGVVRWNICYFNKILGNIYDFPITM